MCIRDRLYLLAPVLTPFLFAALLAYLGDPLIDRLEMRKIERSMAVTLVFGVIIIGLLLLILLLIPISAHQFKGLMQKIPVYIDWFHTSVLPWLRDTLGIDPVSYTHLDVYKRQDSGNAQTEAGLSNGAAPVSGQHYRAEPGIDPDETQPSL